MKNLIVTLRRSPYLLLIIAGFMQVSALSANECLKVMPGNASPDGQPKICQSDFSGALLDYACQDYQADKQHYRILYRGGTTPRAVMQLNHNGSQQVIATPATGEKLHCPLPAPSGIPAYAAHLGSGICIDDNDEKIACSIYEHEEARKYEQFRHMVYFNSAISPRIDTEVNYDNQDALAAELAYQIGMRLKDSSCCSEQAVEYLAYALKLFPHARVYREAYQLSLASAENR